MLQLIFYNIKVAQAKTYSLVIRLINTLPVESSITPIAIVIEPNIMEGFVVSNIKFILNVS